MKFYSLFIFVLTFCLSQNLYAQEWKLENLSFDFKSYPLNLNPGVLIDELIEISPFEAPGKEGVIIPPKFRIIMGFGSLSLFDALNVNEVAGLKREDAVQHIESLRLQGKTEKDGAFIAGLTNLYNGREFFVFFNLERMKHSTGYASRLIAHEPLHMARLLITTIENPTIDYINDPWTNLTDNNEEYFAEMLERISAICFDRYFSSIKASISSPIVL